MSQCIQKYYLFEDGKIIKPNWFPIKYGGYIIDGNRDIKKNG